MTEIANKYLGNITNDASLSQQLATETYLEVYLQPSDRVKGRIHVHSQSGAAIGIIKGRDRILQNGDVWQTDSGKLVLIHLQQQEVLVLDLSTLTTDILPAQLVYLGHVLGNHHYPIAINHNKIYVQLVTDKNIIEKTIKNLNISGLQIYYQCQPQKQEIIFSSHTH